MRFTAAGLGDKSFGHGAVITSFGQPSAITRILIARRDGKIVASGKTTSSIAALVPNQLEVALARYNIDGSLDKTFSATGTAVITLQGGVSEHRDIVTVGSSNDLLQQFKEFKQSAQGALAINQGGELFDDGTSGTDTVEAAVITSGVDLATRVVGLGEARSVIGGMRGVERRCDQHRPRLRCRRCDGELSTLLPTPLSEAARRCSRRCTPTCT